MSSEKLKQTHEYEAVHAKAITEQERPVFHLSPMTGWMNDPNGFSYYEGKYHMFYQYNPYDTNWGPMHWGHAVSEDMLHWEYLPAALAPDREYDNAGGCFSGSAETLPDGRQLLMYTGVAREKQEDGSMADIQTQCMAVGDGTQYTKYEGNPVLTASDLPEGASRMDFRDPKMWRSEDGTFYCVVGNRPADGSGQILLYESEDGFDWKFNQTLIQNKNRFGKMWECPDFFELDGKWVLLTSPQDVQADGLSFGSGNIVIAVIGHMDKKGKFVEETVQTIDYGIDFYAPQTTKTPDGRRVMIGWMQNWDTCSMRMDDTKWYGQMSCPRELALVDGKLIQKPVRELEQLYIKKTVYEDVIVDNKLQLDEVCGRTVDMIIELEAENVNELYHGFTISVASDGHFHSDIVFRPFEKTVELDRTCSGVRRAVLNQKKCHVKTENGGLKLRIILDRYSAEVFVNDGEQVLTMTYYTELCADQITFDALGSVKMKVEKYEITK